MTEPFVDCALFQFGCRRYILPMVAAVEFLLATDKALRVERLGGTETKIIGKIYWRNQLIPMFLPDFSVSSEQIKPAKIVITRSMKIHNQQGYLAFPFEGTPKRLKLTPSDISWKDQVGKDVFIQHNHQQIEASILDVTHSDNIYS